MIDFEESFIQVTQEYLEASAKLAQATALCGDDPIKQDMIGFILPDFEEMCARSEGVRTLAETAYNDNREFIISEMKEITIINLRIAEQIEKKLAPLVDLI